MAKEKPDGRVMLEDGALRMEMGPGQAHNDFVKYNNWTEHYAFEPSMTRQEFAVDCDINAIMARYEKTGQLPVNGRQPMYVDFTQLPSTLMEHVAFLDEAQKAFMSLPAVVRKEFDNDPVAFVEYASQEGNLDQMREWGLAPPAALVEDAVGDPGKVDAAPAPAPAAPPPPASKPTQ